MSRPVPTFDTVTTMEVAVPSGPLFSVDVEKRIIRGRAVPYGVVGLTQGQKFQFSRGTVRPRDGMRVKLWALHEKNLASGVITEWDDNDEGLDIAARVAPGPEGDRALAMAKAEVWDGFSIGPSEGARFELRRDGVHHAVDVPIHEISLTPAPVFGGARVTSVKFDAETETPVKCTKCGVVHPAGVAECKPEDVTAFEAANAADAPTFDVQPIADALGEALAAGFAQLGVENGPQIVNHGDGLHVNEPSPYRFDGAASEHSFSEDLRDSKNDSEARQRIVTFMQEAHDVQFAVTTGNVGTLNPVKNRPDLFVPNLTFTRPLWDMVTTESIADKTPFTLPKFGAAAGLVGPHTEGVEPTPGSFSATSQTITPGAVSGKVEINREVWDQGGTPKADAIIWGEMQNGYYEGVESKIATTLAAVATAEVNFASAVDAALLNAVTNLLVDLQFTRGGNRFSGLALDGLFFKALVNAADTTNRKLLSPLGATNAQGQVSQDFGTIQLGNLIGRAAWALGASTASRSYLLVPSMVRAYASAPKRFDWDYRAAAVDLGIWGYTAAAVLRDSDVKPLDYTTAD